MSEKHFIVKTHIVPAQHIRELPNALAVDENTPLHLNVTQYIPRNNTNPKSGDITIIALHANAFTHEVYEPLWDDLIASLPEHTRIRGIWMADQVQKGESYVLNESKLANGMSWDDHPRDLLHIINTFRDQMSQPLIGIAHSMGAPQLVALCKIHPRLFRSVAFLDPWMAADWISRDPIGNWKRTLARRDKFESLELAAQVLRKSPVMKRWDQRVFDRYMSTAFRSGPTILHPQNEKGVVLKTPREMEFYTATRVNLEGVNADSDAASRLDRLEFPDMKYNLPMKIPYYMPLPKSAGEYLCHLRPRAMYLYGAKGSASTAEWIVRNVETTGTACGGSGGINVGAVQADTVAGGHFFPFENPGGTAERLAVWLESESKVLEREKSGLEARLKTAGRNARARQEFPKEYLNVVKDWEKRYIQTPPARVARILDRMTQASGEPALVSPERFESKL